jgi:dihydrofolate synthase/folylpolyglutamate synthase
MEQLGPTIEAIALEKAAIIERGDIAVTGATGNALAIVRRRAARLRVPLTVTEPAPLLGWDRNGIEVDLPRLGRTQVGLRGRHQAANVAVADGVLDALEHAGIASVGGAARRTGYANAVWPGRLELLDAAGRDVLLDGAHNPAGAEALAQAVDDLRPFLEPGRITLLTATMADKDVDGLISALTRSPELAGARVVATALDAPRALGAEVLAQRWRTLAPEASVESVPETRAALDRALDSARGPVVVAGSLYLVGAVRGQLVDDPALRDG